MDRTPQVGDLVELTPNLPVLAKVLKRAIHHGRDQITLQWPSGQITTHETEMFQTVVTAHRLASFTD